MRLDFPHAGEVYSLACALVWAVAVLLFQRSGEHTSAVALSLFKNLFATVLFLLTLVVLGVPLFPEPMSLDDARVLFVSGALGLGCADPLFLMCLRRLGAARTAIVDCFYSPAVCVCAALYLSEPVGPGLVVSLGLVMAAVALGAWEPSPSRPNESRRDLLVGVGLGVVALVTMAIGIVYAKPVLDRSDPWWTTTVRLLGGLAVTAALACRRSERVAVANIFVPTRSWWLYVPAAFLGTYVSMAFWILGMKYTSATKASVLNQTSTVFTVVLAVLFLKERLTGRKALAIILGAAGAVIATLEGSVP